MSDKQTLPDAGNRDKEEKALPMFEVYDMNQRGPNGRVHEVIVKFYPKDPNGFQPDPETVQYALFSNKPCPMPMDHAMKFLRDPQFKVISPAGHRIMPVPVEDHTKPISVLGEDEVVVKYAELSREALFRRVKVIPGSEDIDERTPVAEMAAFMANWRKSMRGMTNGEQRLAEMMSGGVLDGQMDQEALDKLIPRKSVA